MSHILSNPTVNLNLNDFISQHMTFIEIVEILLGTNMLKAMPVFMFKGWNNNLASFPSKTKTFLCTSNQDFFPN